MGKIFDMGKEIFKDESINDFIQTKVTLPVEICEEHGCGLELVCPQCMKEEFLEDL